MNNYFVFCWCPKSWLSRAIFVPLDNIDNKILLDIEKLIKLGPIIEEVWHHEKNCGNIEGFIANDGTKINIFDELGKLVNSWARISDHGCECNCDEELECICPIYYKNSFIYYINDENRHLSPSKLYEKIKMMTSYKDKSFVVKDCVLLSEMKSDANNQKPLRFFYTSKEQISKENVEKLLMDNFDFKKIIIAGNDKSDTGYGYVYQKDINKEADLLNKKFENENFKVLFDRN